MEDLLSDMNLLLLAVAGTTIFVFIFGFIFLFKKVQSAQKVNQDKTGDRDELVARHCQRKIA